MLIPADRLFDWDPGVNVGIVGGIPTDRTNIINVTEAPYNADNTGVTNAGPAIQSAVDAAVANDIVYLPAGTYLFESGVSLLDTASNVTVRGDGETTEIILADNSGAFYVGMSNDYLWDFPMEPVTDGLTQGSTVLTMADTSEFSNDILIKIFFENEEDETEIEAGQIPTMHVFGYPNVRSQISRVVSKTGTTLTIFPGIYHVPRAGLDAWVSRQSRRVKGVGLEDMKIDASGTTAQSTIYTEQIYGCWFKGLHLINCVNRHIHIQRSFQCEFRKNYFDGQQGVGPNHAGILMDDCGSMLVEDNIFDTIFPSLEVNFGTSGCVFSYNLFENSPIEGNIFFPLDANHGPHNAFNLYEGNISPNIVTDGYYGSCSEDTICRNWFHGSCFDSSAVTFTHTFKRLTRDYNVVGNILGKNGVVFGEFSYGQPNIGNGSSIGTAQPTLGDFWIDYKAPATLTVRSSDTTGTITLDGSQVFAEGQQGVIQWTGGSASFTAGTIAGSTVVLTSVVGVLPAQDTALITWAGPLGYQELDLDVEASTIEKGNYTYGVGGSAGSMSSTGGDPIPDSFIYSSRPSWFYSLAFPAFDPTEPNSSSYESIPAGYRFVNGEDPPAEGGVTISVANVTNFNVV